MTLFKDSSKMNTDSAKYFRLIMQYRKVLILNCLKPRINLNKAYKYTRSLLLVIIGVLCLHKGRLTIKNTLCRHSNPLTASLINLISPKSLQWLRHILLLKNYVSLNQQYLDFFSQWSLVFERLTRLFKSSCFINLFHVFFKQ